jgi:PilZ domain
MDERRKSQRFQVRVEARVSLGPERFTGLLKDVCRDAVLVEVDRSIPMGSELAMALELPGAGGPLQIVGRVVRQASDGRGGHDVAVLFTDLTPATETRIDFFLALQAQRAAEQLASSPRKAGPSEPT